VGLVGYGLLLTLGVALFVAPFACPWPDGLEKVATSLGFVQHSETMAAGSALFSDYRWPGVGSAIWATAWAGAAGTVVAFGLAWLLSVVLIPRKEPPAVES
jgi:cobalt/nickel transport protein